MSEVHVNEYRPIVSHSTGCSNFHAGKLYPPDQVEKCGEREPLTDI